MRLLLSLLSVATLSLTTGCIVVPPRHYAAAVEPAPVYVEPAYASPGVGFVWRVHPRYGWGWYHPHYGWHRGWR